MVTDRACVKVKTGPRRGALWRDEDGQWWLLAAGWRKDDGSGDFYEAMARLAGDSTPIASTEADFRLARLASAYAIELELERAARRRVLAAVTLPTLRASRSGACAGSGSRPPVTPTPSPCVQAAPRRSDCCGGDSHARPAARAARRRRRSSLVDAATRASSRVRLRSLRIVMTVSASMRRDAPTA